MSQDFLSQAEVDLLLKGVTHESDVDLWRDHNSVELRGTKWYVLTFPYAGPRSVEQQDLKEWLKTLPENDVVVTDRFGEIYVSEAIYLLLKLKFVQNKQ